MYTGNISPPLTGRRGTVTHLIGNGVPFGHVTVTFDGFGPDNVMTLNLTKLKDEKMNKFWMVLTSTKRESVSQLENAASRRTFASKEEAISLAEHCAKLYPNSRYVVVQAVTISESTTVTTIELE